MKVQDGMDTVAEYEYDGLNRRIVKAVYSGGSHDRDEHFYLSEQNQVLEVRLDSSSNPYKQFTWGTRYVDDLVFRTRDTDDNGTLDETLYALQDANWHITAIADTSGAITERFQYDPYGKSTVLDADFTNDSDNTSDYAWESRFTSQEYDAETGLHYFNARYYHNTLGRFIGRDPIEHIDGASFYAAFFVPTDLDPSGLVLIQCSCTCGMMNAGTPKVITTNCTTSNGLACCKTACPASGNNCACRGQCKWKIDGAADDKCSPDDCSESECRRQCSDAKDNCVLFCPGLAGPCAALSGPGYFACVGACVGGCNIGLALCNKSCEHCKLP